MFNTKTTIKYFLFASVLFFLLPVFKAQGLEPKTLNLNGTVTQISGLQVYFKSPSSAKYTAEISTAKLFRKNGTEISVSEILPGDKIEVKGKVWPDNSINAEYVKNLSLYPHRSTFIGKITGINFQKSEFTLESGSVSRLVKTSQLTAYKNSGSISGFSNLEIGMSATVKAAWERKDSVLTAESVEAKQKLINITITGTLVMTSPEAFTIVGDNNVIYGISLNNAVLVSKSGKKLSLSAFQNGQQVKVEGKHTSGLVKIFATKIRNLNFK